MDEEREVAERLQDATESEAEVSDNRCHMPPRRCHPNSKWQRLSDGHPWRRGLPSRRIAGSDHSQPLAAAQHQPLAVAPFHRIRCLGFIVHLATKQDPIEVTIAVND